MIELKNINKRYVKDSNEVRALVDVDLRIAAGEFIAIVGPSGSGKSTLMHTIGLLDRPDSGTYLFEGRNVDGLTPDDSASVRNAKIGFVFQAFHLLPRTPAVENVELPLIYSDRDDIDGLGLRALEQVGLRDRAQHHPGELSGGEQQRVAIARALVNDPALVLADEPTGNLDSDSGREIMEVFRDLNERGKTVVIVTHDQAIADHARRTVRMVDGRIVSDDASGDRDDSDVTSELLGTRGTAQ